MSWSLSPVQSPDVPFGTENNDLPLDAICNAIEIDLLQMNDEAEIPAKILPDRHYQLT